jgi:type III pantothenate kinase
MSLLVMDAGNSRLKWALVREPYRRGQAFAAQGAIELAGLQGRRSPLRALFRALVESGLQSRVHVCNVAGSAIERLLRSAARQAGVTQVRFARSAAEACGVRNSYREAWRLGTDRWVALIGAHHEHPNTDLCLVGIGTALTIDLLDAGGRHVGGQIIPGPRLMIESLLQRTAGIQRRAGGRGVLAEVAASASGSRLLSPFAHDTRTALLAGARHACAAAIEQARRDAGRQLGRRPRLILAGGAAGLIAPLLSSPHRREDDLILRGMAVLAATAAR